MAKRKKVKSKDVDSEQDKQEITPWNGQPLPRKLRGG